jgi:hypothetical protein
VSSTVLEQPGLFDRSDLPGSLDGWDLVDFTTERNERDMARFSQSWTYQSNSCACQLSVAYPYTEWHDLTLCYRGTGWQVANRMIVTPKSTSGDPNSAYVVVELTQPSGDHALVLFGHVDYLGRMVRPPEDIIGTITSRITNGFVRSSLFNIQAMVTSPHRLTPPQRKEVHDLFLKSRDLLCSAFTTKRQPATGEITERTTSLPDLLRAKRTQRDKDWPMTARLLEAHYYQNTSSSFDNRSLSMGTRQTP